MKRLYLLVLLIAGGCATPAPPLPVYPLADSSATLAILQEHARRLHSLAARCTLVLTRKNGESVQLDGAMAFAPPDRLRLRAWKAGQAVFDLTLRPDGVWIEAPDDPAAREKILPATTNTAMLGKQLLEFVGGFFDDAQPDGITANTVTYRHDSVFCQVDRATLTPTRYWLVDSAGVTRFELVLSEYRDFQGILWPMHLSATQEAGDRIEMEFADLDINTGLAAGAFIPPRRAEKRP